MIFLGNPVVKLISVPFLFGALMLDTLDGIVARKTGTTSLFGSVLDIAADRTYEIILWVVLAYLGTISLVLPVIVIGRTVLSDAIRSVGVSRGFAPFEQLHTRIGRFIVASPIMRSSYSVLKVATFCGLTLGYALSTFPGGSSYESSAESILHVFAVTAVAAVVVCVLRGVPVIVSGLRLLREQPD